MNIKIQEYLQTQSFTGVLAGIFIMILILFIFQAGVALGERKASFAYHLGNNFERNFKDPQGGFFMPKGFSGVADMPGGHGAVGKIVSITLPLVVVAGPDNLEKTVVLTADTEVREFRTVIPASELTVGDFIVVLGTPNSEGQIEAKLIRLAPPPPNAPLHNESPK